MSGEHKTSSWASASVALPSTLTIFAQSERGSRDHNDDAYADAELMAGRCLVVADGAGGHRGGALAARTAIDALLLHLAAAPQWNKATLVAGFDAASEAVHEKQRESGLEDMSSTLVVLCLDAVAGTAQWANLGDSRALHFRRGAVDQLTSDHSVLQSFIDAGLAQPDRAWTGPARSLLYAAVGSEGDTRPAIGEPMALEDGDAFLLCTDGVWDTVPAVEIERLLRFAGSVKEWVELIAAAVRHAEATGQDNFTCVGAWLGTPRETTVIRV